MVQKACKMFDPEIWDWGLICHTIDYGLKCTQQNTLKHEENFVHYFSGGFHTVFSPLHTYWSPDPINQPWHKPNQTFLPSSPYPTPKLFQRCLMSVLNIDLWKCYITYVKQTKATLQTYRWVHRGQRLSPWWHTPSMLYCWLQREAATDVWVCFGSCWYRLSFRVSLAGLHSVYQRRVSDYIIMTMILQH